jgi:hypothetical protein
LPLDKLEHQRDLARKASQRRRHRVLQQEAQLSEALEVTEAHHAMLEAQRLALARELRILRDVVLCRYHARQ